MYRRQVYYLKKRATESFRKADDRETHEGNRANANTKRARVVTSVSGLRPGDPVVSRKYQRLENAHDTLTCWTSPRGLACLRRARGGHVSARSRKATPHDRTARCQAFTVVTSGCLGVRLRPLPRATRRNHEPGRRARFRAEFPRDRYRFCTIKKLKNPKSGTLCRSSSSICISRALELRFRQAASWGSVSSFLRPQGNPLSQSFVASVLCSALSVIDGFPR